METDVNTIVSKLGMKIAQLEIDKVILEAQVEMLTKQLEELNKEMVE